MKFTISPLELTDRQAWEELFYGYADFYNVDMKTNDIERVWSWIFDDAEEFWCDVAKDDTGKLIGFTQYQLMHRSLGGNKVVYLSDLFSLSNKRGLGVGRALIDAVFDFARERQITNVRWLTQESNYKARALYDSYSTKSEFILYAIPTGSRE